ncbi:MAG: hypothetical protein MJH10_09285 [Epibacterium sp.]|nr:hypothetical protein [Epibacterium sp.]NQX73728.1 hypothetical protein [Epibacterium sp.]
MAIPPSYSITTNFASLYGQNPAAYDQQSSPRLDTELADIQTSLNQTIDGLNEIRASDGTLATGIVVSASIAPSFYDDLAGEFAAATQADRQASEDAATLSQTSAAQAANSASDAQNSASIATARSSDASASATTAATQAADAQQSATDAAQAQAGALAAQSNAQLAAANASTAEQGGISARDSAIAARNEAESFVAPASSHVNDLNNPHQTTPEQVRSFDPLWNANKIFDKPVTTNTRAPSTVVTFDGAQDAYTHSTINDLLGAGDGFIGVYPINFSNIDDGRILVFNELPGNPGGEFIFLDQAIGGGGGATVFTDLGDTPSAITANFFLRGSANGQALEYVRAYTADEIDQQQLADAQARDLLQVAINANTAAIQNLDVSGIDAAIDDLQQDVQDIQNELQTVDNRLDNIEAGGVGSGSGLSTQQLAVVAQIAQTSGLQAAWVM